MLMSSIYRKRTSYSVLHVTPKTSVSELVGFLNENRISISFGRDTQIEGVHWSQGSVNFFGIDRGEEWYLVREIGTPTVKCYSKASFIKMYEPE